MSPSSSTVTKCHFLWYAFSNIWRCLIFTGDSHAFLHIWNVFINVALILKSYLAWSFVDVMFSSGNFGETSSASCLSCTCRALPRANLHISVLRTCPTPQKAVSESSGTNALATFRRNRKALFVFFLCFHAWQNPELWETICISRTPYWFSWFSGTNTVEQ